ncbi:ABC-three component system middle component 2 [Knoellia sp. S7-12]|uniref:ABC-three component system middle component 2 n=1 Tax=Knoellia sp. S7-12 TaxID=3126698 RepID=UPI00338FB4BD
MILLNGPFESSIHTACLLTSAWPEPLDVDRLALMEHFVLFGGPDVEGIQPPIGQASTGLSTRRSNVRSGLQVLLRAGLAETEDGGAGFRATESAPAFVSLLESPAALKMRATCQQAANTVGRMNDEDLVAAFAQLMLAELRPAATHDDGTLE